MSRPVAPTLDDDVLNPKLSISCLDFLLIELVPLAQRLTDQLHAREQALLLSHPTSTSTSTADDADTKKLTTTTTTTTRPPAPPSETASSLAGTATSTFVSGLNPSLSHAPPDSNREAVHWRLDRLGYRVGQGLAEKVSLNKPRAAAPLDAIKLVCKDLWPLLFRKPIDNLKTNHRGVFVLTDTRFPVLVRVSVDRRAGGSALAAAAAVSTAGAGGGAGTGGGGGGGGHARAVEESMRRAQTLLVFPCGIIRGALSALGVEVTVTAETTEIPIATFQIKTKGAKA